MYIQGFAAKSVKAGNYVIGTKELLNQRFLKVEEGNNFGVIKIFVRITQELMKDMQFSWQHPFLQPPTLVTNIVFKKLPNYLSSYHWNNGPENR